MANDTIPADYPNSVLSPNESITSDRSPANFQSTHPSTTAFDAEPSANTSIGILRKQYGPAFARGFGDNDTLADLLAKSGAGDLQAYIAKAQKS